MDIYTAAALAEHSAEDACVSQAVGGMDKLLLTLQLSGVCQHQLCPSLTPHRSAL